MSLTKREQFAAYALQGILAREGGVYYLAHKEAVEFADALTAELDRTAPEPVTAEPPAHGYVDQDTAEMLESQGRGIPQALYEAAPELLDMLRKIYHGWIHYRSYQLPPELVERIKGLIDRAGG